MLNCENVTTMKILPRGNVPLPLPGCTALWKLSRVSCDVDWQMQHINNSYINSLSSQTTRVTNNC